MTVRAKTKPVPSRPRPAPALLPPGVEALLSREQVCTALGGITRRKHEQMVAAGQYPRPDAHVGNRPRWSVALHNAWLRGQTGR